MNSGVRRSPIPPPWCRTLYRLNGMERRDLAHANSLSGPDFNKMLPGGHRMESIEILVERSKGRYRGAKERFDRHGVVPQADGSAVVSCHGTLRGELNDRSICGNIRCIAGPDPQGGGRRFTRVHRDDPMRGCASRNGRAGRDQGWIAGRSENAFRLRAALTWGRGRTPVIDSARGSLEQ